MATDYGNNRVLGSSGTAYDAVFTNKTDRSELTGDDFLKLLMTQLQNQDFTSPMDNSTMVTQMAQLSNMQMMQKMSASMQSSYALELVGKTATASGYTLDGPFTTTGVIDKVVFDDTNGYLFYIGGKGYTLSQITGVQASTGGSGTGTDKPKSEVDPTKYEFAASQITANSAHLAWKVPTDDTATAEGLTYTVYYSKTGPMETLEQVEKNGAIYGDAKRKALTAEDITGLQADTTYYFNVVVEDAKGGKAVYKPVSAKTEAA